MKINKEQKLAAQTIDGPVLILASAGTGKTTCLVHRLVEMVKRGISHESILCLTFTNRAADIMAKKVSEIIGPHTIEISTFHSFCYRILKSTLIDNSIARNFVIIDDTDQKKVLRDVISDLHSQDHSVAEAKERISLFKRQLKTTLQIETELPDDEIASIYKEYQNRIEASNVLDFSDLIFYTVAILQASEVKRKQVQAKYQYIMIDEYQDTNQAQFMLSQILAGDKNNICVVGDDSQSIYGFQGAQVRNILDFPKFFSGAKTITLFQNYRSIQCILSAADEVIRHNKERTDKKFVCTREGSATIEFLRTETEYDEALKIASKIMDLRDEGTSLKDIAILYRANWQSRPLESTLRQLRIPHEVVDSTSFYDRREIKDITAYLQFFLNPADSIHLERIINVPRRGIGKKTIQIIKNKAEESKTSMWEAMKSIFPNSSTVTLFQKYIDADKTSIYNFTLSLLEDTNFIESLEEEERQGRVLELLEDMKSFRIRISDDSIGNASVDAWLGIASLASSTDDWSEEDRVKLLTIHSAKGTEFQAVFISGMEEGIFPHYRSIENGDIEEERRLCYVALTRAKDRLFLTHCNTRTYAGKTSVYPRSRFMEEMKC